MTASPIQDYSFYSAQVLITNELSYLSSERAEEWWTEVEPTPPITEPPMAEQQFQYKTKQKAKEQSASCNPALLGQWTLESTLELPSSRLQKHWFVFTKAKPSCLGSTISG